MKPLLLRYLDDFLLLLGCLCVLYGLALWNIVVTWVSAGVMLIVFSVLIGKAKANHAAE